MSETITMINALICGCPISYSILQGKTTTKYMTLVYNRKHSKWLKWDKNKRSSVTMLELFMENCIEWDDLVIHKVTTFKTQNVFTWIWCSMFYFSVGKNISISLSSRTVHDVWCAFDYTNRYSYSKHKQTLHTKEQTKQTKHDHTWTHIRKLFNILRFERINTNTKRKWVY